MRKRFTIYVSTFLFYISIPQIAHTQYSITANYINSNSNFERVTLEYIPSLTGLTTTVQDNLVNSVKLDSAGILTMQGSEIPEHKMLYRIALQDGASGIGIYTGLQKNYIHVVLDNKTQLDISTCDPFVVGISNCLVHGNVESQIIQQMYDQIIPDMVKENIEYFKVKTETKKEFLLQRHVGIMKTFADTSQHLIPSIMAIQMIDDLKLAIKEDPDYFSRYIKKINSIDQDHPYTIEIRNQITTHKETLYGKKKDYRSWWIGLLSMLCMILGSYVLLLRNKLKHFNSSVQKKKEINVDVQSRINALSPKEKEVFELMKSGSSNKEIANQLFIEPTTVKSHISKIYQKLQIASRKEISQFIDNQGATT